MAFLEEQFPTTISINAQRRITDDHTVLMNRHGYEQRYRGTPSGGIRVFTFNRNNIDNTDYNEVINFNIVSGNSLDGFRFKDWKDYLFIKSYLGTGDGVEDEFQLQKQYTVGSTSAYKKISKPVSGTTLVYFNDVLQVSGWGIDITTGLITLTAPLTLGVDITASSEYDVPTRFTGSLSSNHNICNYSTFQSIVLREIIL